MLHCKEKQTMFLEFFHQLEGLRVELESWTKNKDNSLKKSNRFFHRKKNLLEKTFLDYSVMVKMFSVAWKCSRGFYV